MHFKTLGEIKNASDAIKNILGDSSLKGKKITDALVSSTKQYSVSVLEAAVAQTGLTKAQAKSILKEKGLKKEVLETTASQWAKNAATTATTTSQTAAAASTLSLKTAYDGLAVSLGVSTTALTTFLGIAAGAIVVVGIIKEYNEQQARLAETTKSSAQETRAASKEIEDYIEQYGKLNKEYNDASTSEERQAEIKMIDSRRFDMLKIALHSLVMLNG